MKEKNICCLKCQVLKMSDRTKNMSIAVQKVCVSYAIVKQSIF